MNSQTKRHNKNITLTSFDNHPEKVFFYCSFYALKLLHSLSIFFFFIFRSWFHFFFAQHDKNFSCSFLLRWDSYRWIVQSIYRDDAHGIICITKVFMIPKFIQTSATRSWGLHPQIVVQGSHQLVACWQKVVEFLNHIMLFNIK